MTDITACEYGYDVRADTNTCRWCAAKREDVEDGEAPSLCVSPDPTRRALTMQIEAIDAETGHAIGEIARHEVAMAKLRGLNAMRAKVRAALALSLVSI